jgi:anti-sigma-K factor RskA
MAAGDTIAVTVEVTGGSPDGLPSDQLVFAIPTGAQGQPT